MMFPISIVFFLPLDSYLLVHVLLYNNNNQINLITNLFLANFKNSVKPKAPFDFLKHSHNFSTVLKAEVTAGSQKKKRDKEAVELETNSLWLSMCLCVASLYSFY